MEKDEKRMIKELKNVAQLSMKSEKSITNSGQNANQ